MGLRVTKSEKEWECSIEKKGVSSALVLEEGAKE
jgi:hypothetical protein